MTALDTVKPKVSSGEDLRDLTSVALVISSMLSLVEQLQLPAKHPSAVLTYITKLPSLLRKPPLAAKKG